MKIKFTKQAVEDIESIYRYILRKSDQDIATKTIHTIYNAINNLSLYAELGTKQKKNNTRRLIIPRIPFVVIYKVDKKVGRLRQNKAKGSFSKKKDKLIYILTIFHTSRKL